MSRSIISTVLTAALKRLVFCFGLLGRLLVTSCAGEKQSTGSENSSFNGISNNISISRSCSTVEGCKTVITEVIAKPYATDAEYNARCQTLADAQNKGQCSASGGSLAGSDSFSSSPSKTQCVFNRNSSGKTETLKTVELSSGGAGGGIDVSKLCSKTGVVCKVTGNSCNGTVDIKIVDSSSAPALNATEIAQICHAYIQPGAVLPMKFSCSYGNSESAQTSVVPGIFAKIKFTPRASE